ncbi:TorF family putative porin [Zhongshania sp. BJYM1]|uniref:TorF family putative porin n=1 Tax=Zhongshania aquatica TaxID=2965069 RepID=UPI0022B327BB|nr:TorF family putative porin [Marortus sp. BJYM1]
MKTMKTLIAASVAAASMTMIAAPASAELSASAGVASSYLWRGYDLSGSGGTPAVYGDISYSMSGFYAGVWASSGDTSFGTEYDLFAGYGMEVGGVSFDLNFTNYVYPGTGAATLDGEADFGDFSEVIFSVGVGSFGASIYKQIAGVNEDYMYFTLSYDIGQFSFLYGMHDGLTDGTVVNGKTLDGETESHINVTYSYNDNLSFTLSQFVDGEDNVNAFAGGEDDLKFVVSYSLPISM